ncbi:hypothetical protein [Neptuniibacter sp.]|uniref:hypothetical protein n=1 Tax=Neptuniibacter sp. TaxID=1962643 RepID=UPI003B5A42C8
MSKDNLFDGAQDADSFVNREEKKSPPAPAPSYGLKLIASGRLDKKNFPCKPMSFHLDNRLDEWMELHASGNRQLMMNYLIAKGIEQVIDNNDSTLVKDMDYFDDKKE